jgi:hypothetical protein
MSADDPFSRLQHLVAMTTAKCPHWPNPVYGTAFLLTKEYALTCAHCLRQTDSQDKSRAQTVTLWFNLWKRECEADVVGEPDRDRDLALLKLKRPADKIAPLPFLCEVPPDVPWKSFAHVTATRKAGITLKGEVDNPDGREPDRADVRCLELWCREADDRVNRASGGPVLVAGGIAGVLVKQLVGPPEIYGNERRPAHGKVYAIPAETIRDYLRGASPELVDSSQVTFTQVASAVARVNNVPALPSYFVERPEISDYIKARLLAPARKAMQAIAICGMGGSGKSTLAARLALATDLKARFPGGVLWASLGQEPRVAALLNSWLERLGGATTPDVETASARLRELLAEREILLVIDDAWDSAVVRPFLAGGARCAALITTRNVLVAQELAIPGAAQFSVDALGQDQAIELLAGRLGRPIEGAQHPEALTVARLVGYLPLALELVAVQVDDGITWAELKTDLQGEVARLETLDVPGAREAIDDSQRKQLSLSASLNLSLRKLSDDDRRRFAWLGVLAEDATFTPDAAAVLWDVDPTEALYDLRSLQYRALVRKELTANSSNARSYRVHDLMGDLARRVLTAPTQPTQPGASAGMGCTMSEGHAVLLRRYRRQVRDGPWHTLKNDGYIYGHLAWHLEKAGWESELHALLREETDDHRNAWHQVRETMAQTAGYADDVDRAWRMAERAAPLLQTAPTAQYAAALGNWVRYALITASINTLAKNIPPKLAAALLEHSAWSPARTLAHLRSLANSPQLAPALCEVIPHLTGESELRNALDLLRSAADADKAAVLKEITSVLPASRLPELWTIIDGIQQVSLWTSTLVTIAPHLSEGMLRQALARVLKMQGTERTDGFHALASCLSKPMILMAIEFLRTLGRGAERDRMLMHLAMRLAELGSPARGVKLARAIEDEFQSAVALLRCAPGLAEGQRSVALGEVRNRLTLVGDSNQQEYLVAGLAPALPAGEAANVITFARQIADPWSRGGALREIARALPEQSRDGLLREAFGLLRQIKTEGNSTRYLSVPPMLAGIASLMSQELLREALDAVWAGRDDDLPESLKALAPYLPPRWCAERWRKSSSSRPSTGGPRRSSLLPPCSTRPR